MADKEYWAVEKVRVFASPTKEKSTLLAIADHADRLGFGCITKYETLSQECGHSARTIRRHVKELVARGELVVWCDLRRRGSSNSFFIPVAAETIAELEARTGISRKQLKLPLVSTDRSGTVVQNTGFLCPSPTANLSHLQGQTDPVTLLNNPINKEEGFVIKKTRKERSEKAYEWQDRYGGPPPVISLETQRLWQEAMQDLEQCLAVQDSEIVDPGAIKVPFTQQEVEE